MTIIASDAFSGASGSLNGRQFDFDPGGSAGTKAWKTTGASAHNSNHALIPGGINLVAHFTSADYAQAKFDLIGGASQGVLYVRGSGSGAAAASYDSTFGAVFVGKTNFRIRRFDSISGSLGDVATTTHSVMSGASEFAMQISVEGSAITASILSSSLVTALTISFETSAGGIPTGTATGVAEYFGASAIFVDNFIIGSNDAPPPPPPPPAASNVYPYNPLGNLVVDLGGLRYY